jgi:hypothetical protein
MGNGIGLGLKFLDTYDFEILDFMKYSVTQE